MLAPRLPQEVVQHILEVEEFTKTDLAVLSHISHPFRNEAQRILFRDPGHFYVGLAFVGSRRTESFFDAIITSPRRLAPLVRTYSQYTRWDDYPQELCGPSVDREQEAIFKKMMQAFKLMHNVKKFRSTDCACDGHFSRMLNSLSQAFPQLEEFCWDDMGGREIIDFLVHRDGVRYLELPEEFDLGDYDQQERERLLLAAKAACTKLEAIAAPIETTKVLLAGKSNIRYLRWTRDKSYKPKYEADVQHLLGKLGNLLHLEYERHNSEPGISFQIVAPHLKELVFLKTSIKIVTRGDPTVFDHLLHLRAIEFFDDRFVPIDIPHELFRRIFAGCHQLRYIDLEMMELDDDNFYCSIYRRVTRSPDAAQILCETVSDLSGSEVDKWDNRIALITRLTTDDTLHTSIR